MRRVWRKAPAGEAPLIRGGAEVREHRLRNGLRVLLAERHADPVVAVIVFYAVGSRHEPDRLAGVSHFLEHMMFKGTARHGKGEVDRITTELGGQNNAFTGVDHTGYWFELASDRWERALEIEADRMRGLLLDPAELDAERDVVLEELAMNDDDPWRVLAREVEAAVFPRHPYGRPIIGFPDTLACMTSEDMRAYYERYYRPSNATVVLCGDFRSKAALAAVRAHFGSLEDDEPVLVSAWKPPIAPVAAEHRLTMHWDDNARRLCIAWPTVPVASEEDYVFDVLGAVLTSGRGSRLYRALVREGLAANVSSHNDARVEGGAFWLFIDGAQGVAPERIEEVLEQELDRLRRENVTPAELSRAKVLLAASDAYESETVSDVAEQLGEFAVDADWRLALDGCARQKKVTAATLRRTADKFLGRATRVTGWCLPDPQSDAVRSA